MNLLFLTLIEISSLNERGIYQDLLKKFRDEGHNVYVISPIERRRKKNTRLIHVDGITILQVKTLNVQKSHFIEKGIGTVLLEHQFLKGLKKFFNYVKFDLVLYSTPPITLVKVIEFVKRRDKAMSYLLLKDIFPQNAIDLNLIKNNSFIHKYFLKKERKLYNVSDAIGCMSKANVNFLLKKNKHIDSKKVEVNPNSILPIDFNKNNIDKNIIRAKYNLPINKKIFVYGGNLGKPQGLDFLLETIEKYNNPLAYFLIVGNGTEFNRIYKWFKDKKPLNAALLNGLPKRDYDELLLCCDVGLIFLDKNFTIPNFPSRLLSYLEMKIPVLCATDTATDIGDIVEDMNCGYKVIAGESIEMKGTLDKMINSINLIEMGENGWNLLNNQYHVDISYNLIINRFSNFRYV